MKYQLLATLALAAILLIAALNWRAAPLDLSRRLTVLADTIAAPAQVLGQIRVQALANGEAELLIYGQIGDAYWGGGISAESIIAQLRGINASTIRVRINSIGGEVAHGTAIYNALKSHPARIEVVVDGQACSIASLIACAGDEVSVYANALIMLHAPMGAPFGNAVELRDAADVLDQHLEAMATSYAAKTGKSAAEIVALLSDGKDHWFTAAQAVEFGLADRVIDGADAEPEPAAAVAALLGYCASISRAPERVSAVLRRRVSASCTPTLFASIPEAAQLAVVANIEDETMKHNLLTVMAAALAAGAAPAGGVPAVDIPAPGEPGAAPAAPAVAAAPTDHAAVAIAAIRDRNQRVHASLNAVMGVAGIRELYDQAILDPTMSLEAVQARAMTLLGAQAGPGNGGAGRVQGGEDQRDKFIKGATVAVLARANLGPREAGNEFSGMTLAQLAGTALERSGISARGLTPDGLARRVLASHTSSDFPLLLSSVAGKALRAAYGAHPSTYQRWCHVGQVSDFKANPRIQLGSFNSLATIPEGGEFTQGTLTEESESITAVTKGRFIRLTRQMIVNDDLGGFVRRAQLLGRAAARTVNNDVYALLTSGASNLGPTLSDGGQLFNATAVTTAGGHANYLASGTAPTVSAVSAGRAAMRKQKDKGLNEVLNIAPRFLLAPVSIEDASWALLNSTADPASSNSNKANYVRDVAKLELITDPYLDSVSATAWYLAADPMDAPLIEVDFLDGNQEPFIDEAIEFLTDSMDMKVRLDYGIAAMEWRGGYRNSGTGG